MVILYLWFQYYLDQVRFILHVFDIAILQLVEGSTVYVQLMYYYGYWYA